MQQFTDQGIKHYGVYPGEVVQHLSAGMCKIYIPGVYPISSYQNPDFLPPAKQAGPIFGGCVKGNGCFSYPNRGAKVLCVFENGDQNYPIYFASLLGGENPTNVKNEGFQFIRDNVSPDDNAKDDTTKNGQDSQQHMINCKNSRILITESGQIRISCKNDKDNKQVTEIFIDEGGHVYIQSPIDVVIDTPSLDINAHDSVTVKTTDFKVFSSNKVFFDTQRFESKASNMFYAQSPAINMDAKDGTFVAQGKMHPPITAK